MDTLSLLESALLELRYIIKKYHDTLDDSDLYSLLQLEKEISGRV